MAPAENVTVWGGFVLGLVTAVSPCPLATNLAAASWLARHAASRRRAVVGACVYTVGRVAAYGVVAAILAFGLLGAPSLSGLLQRWLPPLLGPLLVVVGMVLLEWLSLPWRFGGAGQATALRLAGAGLLGEFALGFVFALSFCPVSAALFFGSLLPPALSSGAPLLPVVAFGVGTALPIGVFAVSVALGAGLIGRIGSDLPRWQGRIRRGAGAGLILIGLYLILRDTLQVLG